jgi:hypothetical protein
MRRTGVWLDQLGPGLLLELGLGLGAHPGGGMRIVWPVKIQCASVMSGLAAMMAVTVTPYVRAMPARLSPALVT